MSSTAKKTIRELRNAMACVQICERLGLPSSTAQDILGDEPLMFAIARAVHHEVDLYGKRIAQGTALIQGQFDYLGMNRLSAMLFSDHPHGDVLVRRFSNDWRAVDRLLQLLTPKQREALIMRNGVRDGVEQVVPNIAAAMGNSVASVEDLITKGMRRATMIINEQGMAFFDIPATEEVLELILLPVGTVFRLAHGGGEQYMVEMQSSADHPGGPRTAVQPLGQTGPNRNKQPVKYLLADEQVIQVF